MGGEITYREIDSLEYEVTLVLYRDCKESAFSPLLGELVYECSSNSSQIANRLRLTEISKISTYCDTLSGNCTPSNTRSTTGVEKFVYSDTIDFKLSKYTVLRNCSDEIIVSNNKTRRSSNTGPSGRIYLEATINLKHPNSSPVFKQEVYPTICMNQPFRFNWSANDADGDSLSYKLITPRTDQFIQSKYTTPDSLPLQVFFPGTRKHPYKNIHANPPHGFYFNSMSGEMIFTPTGAQKTPLVVQVTEWRKDGNGTSRRIGTTMREIQTTVNTCPDNNPPEIKGPYSYDICLGDSLCFDIETDDEQFIPQPPNLPRPPDSLTVSWDMDIPGATFELLNPLTRTPTGRFCWKPDSSDISPNRYEFTVTAQDNACPINARTTRKFFVRVLPHRRIKAEIQLEKLSCNSYEVDFHLPTGIDTSRANSSWSVWSEKEWPFSHQDAKFSSTRNYFSDNRKDTIEIAKAQEYYLSLQLSNAPVCENQYLDTIEISEGSIIQPIAQDTIVCANSTLTITTQPFNQGNSTFSWLKDTVELSGESDASLVLDKLVPGSSEKYIIETTDSNGCSLRDDIYISAYEKIPQNIDSFYAICNEDSLVLSLSTDNSNIFWSPSGDTSLSIKLRSNSNIKVQYRDKYGCKNQMTSNVSFGRSINLGLQDSIVSCDDTTITLTPIGIYEWSTEDTSNEVTLSKTSKLWVKLTDSLGCISTDSSMVIISKPLLPTLTRFRNFIYSDQEGFHYWYLNDKPIPDEHNKELEISETGVYKAVYVDENGCESDTAQKIVETLEVQDLEQIGLRVYPNPSEGEFQLYSANRNQIDVTQMYVLNNLGQRVALEWQQNSQGYFVKFNEPEGLYHLGVVTKNSSYFLKLMIR